MNTQESRNFSPPRMTTAFYPAARVLGLALYFAALVTYRSNANRSVFGIWSYPFLCVVAVSAVLMLYALLALGRHLRHLGTVSPAARLIDLAILCWGVAYLINAKLDPVEAGRVITLNFFGSCNTLPALLEWLSLVLLFLAAIPWMARNLNKSWGKVAMSFASIFFLLLMLEGFLRVKAAIAPVDEGYPTCSSQAWSRKHVKLNQSGWRDVEHSVLTTAARRLLVVGDSYAFGWGIPNIESRLGEQVAARLQQETGQNWEAINASRGGANTLDEIEFLRRTVAYRPDVVLLLYVFNDIEYLAPEVTPKLPARAQYYPQWVLYHNFYLFQEIIIRLRLIDYRLWAESHSDPYMNNALVSRHLQDVARFVAMASQAGTTVLVVPFEIDTTPQFRKRYAHFIQNAVAAGLPLCSLEHTYDGYQPPQLTVNALDGHPNELANRLAAETVVKCLAPSLHTGASPLQ
jgi:lysophospholipase L1-like esterase